MTPKRINYLSQDEIRKAIHTSKKTFCWYADDHYSDFDCIVQAVTEITPDAARAAMPRKAEAATRRAREQARTRKGKGLTPSESNLCVVDPATYKVCDIVFRLMTDEHVPADPDPKGAARRTGKLTVNFPPFKHFICDDAGTVTEVGRSHWEGSLGNGGFSVTHGKLTNKLGHIYMLLAHRLGTKGNYRGYTYLDEMRGAAVETLCKHGLKFDESKSDNAFAYLTVCATNAFNRVLNLEKQQRNMRDDLMEAAGMAPSMTRQIDNDFPQLATPPVGRGRRIKGSGVTLTAFGKTMTLNEWGAERGLRPELIRSRLKNGLTPEDALSQESFRRGRQPAKEQPQAK